MILMCTMYRNPHNLSSQNPGKYVKMLKVQDLKYHTDVSNAEPANHVRTEAISFKEEVEEDLINTSIVID